MSEFRDRRDAMGLTQEDCAKRLGVSAKTLQRLENPRLGDPPAPALWRFAFEALASELWQEKISLVLYHAMRGAQYREDFEKRRKRGLWRRSVEEERKKSA